MILFLRALALVVLGSMLTVTTWASLQQALFAIPREVYTNPWFIATLVDAYWGFIAFYVWIAWKEQSLAARALWLPAVLALGNIAMAVYALRELFAVRLDAPLAEVVTRRHATPRVVLPGVLVALSVGVYLLA